MVGQRMKPQENVSFRLKSIMPGAKKTLRRTFVSLGKTLFPQETKVRLRVFLSLA
tara:strand:+ start:48 stop:212 length:165 start_codon:yes stop_codon:yes gene_type:complete